MAAPKRLNGLRAAQIVSSVVSSLNEVELESLTKDWRAFLEKSFSTSPEQREWLHALSPEQLERAGRSIVSVVKSGGTERLVVAFVPSQSMSSGFFHELRHEAVKETSDNMRSNFVIAHCDANCENWGWGPG